MNSLLIKGGRVIQGNTVTPLDLLIKDGVIARLDPPRPAIQSPQATQVIELDGDYVSAGFIDLHTHIFDHSDSGTPRVIADSIGINQGVACLVDTGSGGHNNIHLFRERVINTQSTRCFAMVNIASDGIARVPGGHAGSPERVSLAGTLDVIERYPDWIRGVKVLASNTHTGAFGIEAVKIARKAAELSNKPLMVHIGNPPPIIEDVLDLLRPGDILTHAYHGKPGGVLGYNMKVLPAFVAAVERGIIIDLGHGQSSFSFDTCAAALDQGMPLHVISSDLHQASLTGRVVSLARTMSKLRLLGLKLTDVVRAVTATPAAALALDERGFGRIAEGEPAHLTIFRELLDEYQVEDSEGDIRTTRYWIAPHTTVIGDDVFKVTGKL